MNNEKHGQGIHCTKVVLIVWLKMPQNLSAKFVCPSSKVLDFNEKRLHCASLVRGSTLLLCYASPRGYGSHSANFDEKVHKPKSKPCKHATFLHISYEWKYLIDSLWDSSDISLRPWFKFWPVVCYKKSLFLA